MLRPEKKQKKCQKTCDEALHGEFMSCLAEKMETQSWNTTWTDYPPANIGFRKIEQIFEILLPLLRSRRWDFDHILFQCWHAGGMGVSGFAWDEAAGGWCDCIADTLEKTHLLWSGSFKEESRPKHYGRIQSPRNMIVVSRLTRAIRMKLIKDIEKILEEYFPVQKPLNTKPEVIIGKYLDVTYKRTHGMIL